MKSSDASNLHPDEPDRDKAELVDAAQELRTSELPPEVNEQTAALEEWDEAPSVSGGEVPRIELEDETPVAEQLVNEGIEEADREQRIAAADEPDVAL